MDAVTLPKLPEEPCCDWSRSQHMHTDSLTVQGSLDTVFSAFDNVIVTGKRPDGTKLFRLPAAEQEGTDSRRLRYMHVSRAGFRDVGELIFRPSSTTTGQTVCDADARSMDPHVWTCLGMPPALACCCCCCGLLPAKDWGENEKFLTDIYQQTNLTYTKQASAASSLL
eukprot:g71385.t1